MVVEKGKFPTTTASFEKIRERELYYVDKTDLVWALLNTFEIVFLSRPRRFGKSLLLDTIACYLEGKAQLFEGLKLHPLEAARGEKAWESIPVIRFDFSAHREQTIESIEGMVHSQISRALRKAGLPIQSKREPYEIFDVLEQLYDATGHRVGVLIDEYDIPLLDMLSSGNTEGLEAVKEFLQGFYRTLKSAERYIRFMMVMGITQFRQVGLFSGFNNIRDISFSAEFNAICGFSEQDIRHDLSAQVERIAAINGLDVEAQMAQLKHKYDGYRFSAKEEDVYNPFGLINALVEGELKDYWSRVGTASSVDLLLPRYDALGLMNLDRPLVYTESLLVQFDYERPDPVPFLYQTGYLTIKGVRAEGDYVLDFPNREVRESIMLLLAPRTLGIENSMGYYGLQRNLVNALNGSDIKRLEACIQAFLASLPHDTEGDTEKAWAMRECRYRDALHLIFAGVRADVRAEQIGAGGLSDVELLGARMIVVIELKIKRHGMTAEQALRQIMEKAYTEKHIGGEKAVWAVGAVIGEKAKIEWAEQRIWEGAGGEKA